MQDLGVYRLRDVLQPERLFQVEAPDLVAREFPPPRAEAGHGSHLPLPFTRFFGREAEVERAVLEKAAGFDLADLNRLIADHNRYYPIEANLAFAKDGGYLVNGRPWTAEIPLTAERLVARALRRRDA